MKKILLALLLGPFLILWSCNGPKSLSKKGNEFSEVGLHRDAINYYIKALEKKPEYVKAKIGLKTSAQAVYNEMSSTFFQAYHKGNEKEAVYSFIELQEFVNRVNKYGGDLHIQSNYEEDFANAKERYLEKQFEAANQLIAEDKFEAAKNIFTEIERLDPDFEGRDFESLKEIATLEPLHRKGNKAIQQEKYRKAYFAFSKICEYNPAYKNARFNRDEALEKAQFSVGVLKFENLTDDPSAATIINSELTKQILKSQDPFIQLIDRTSVSEVLNEQLLSMKGLTSSSLALQAGELIGAKALLKGSVLEIKTSSEKPRTTAERAYKEIRTKKYDPVKKTNYYETTYQKVNYTRTRGTNEAKMSFKIQLISSETGQILLSEIIEVSDRSDIDYSSYKGNYRELVPGHWKSLNVASSEDKIFTSSSAVTNFRRQFNASKNLKPLEDMKSELEKEIAYTAARLILDFNPEEN